MEDKEYSSGKRKRGDDDRRRSDRRRRWSDSKTEREGTAHQVSSSNELGVLFLPTVVPTPGSASHVVSLPIVVQRKPSKTAPVLRLDARGMEVDEHGSLVNQVPKVINTLKVNINRQEKEAAFKIKPEVLDQLVGNKNPYLDARIDKTKLFRPKKKMALITKEAEVIKSLIKSQSGRVAKAKEQQLIKAKQATLDIVVDWWDVPFLQSAGDDTVIDEDKMEKIITIYVEHPQPIEPPTEPIPPPPQPLKLTKNERKKLGTQRRLAGEKDRQEMIRLGVLEPPKPKLKMSNLMKDRGPQATQHPTKLEMETKRAVAEREKAHVDRNIARKLTPGERREKKEKKLFHNLNNNTAINVSIYKIVNGLSQYQARYKVDINAQQNRLTGCAVNISQGMCIAVVEGGAKWIKKYERVMRRRIDWTAPKKEEEDGEKPLNKCVLVWQGSVDKPSFD